MKLTHHLTRLVMIMLVMLVAGMAHAQGPSFAVTPESYDDMGEILTKMGRPWQQISQQDLASYQTIKNYQAIFINCDDIPDDAAKNAAQSLRQYVAEGGSVYASDWAVDYIMEAFPGKLDLYGMKELKGQAGAEQHIEARITHQGLAAFLNPVSPPATLELEFDIGGWVVIDKVASDVRVYLRGDVRVSEPGFGDWDDWDWDNWDNYDDWDEWDGGPEIPTTVVNNKPLLVSFEHGAGRVIYTSFHNEEQLTALQEKLLVYLVVMQESYSTLQQMQNKLQSDYPGIGITEFVGTIKQSATSQPVKINVTSITDLVIAAGWGGSELKLSVYQPDGQPYKSQSSSNPPIIIEAKDAQAGEWSYTVEGVDVPHEDYSYVVLAGLANGASLDPDPDPDPSPSDPPAGGNDGKKSKSSGGGCFVETIR